ncbi:hypothetical protein HUO13_14675 [Saccharopolyspora erythraea]|uniref:CoA transferase n=1 Tax=Saccharopolyspora erythraea TaxID=1836 RepID=UPI001BA953D2|nr:CoA transferase [Saccharopolyspora erythraea]QUH01887.1 hypothetical protein HUO13_14675 [Saccharopolyspora erythraea]
MQIWGIPGPQQEVVVASERAIVVVEEIVDRSVVRADPNRTVIPGFAVDAIVARPRGDHPSYMQGYYDRDNDFYRDRSAISSAPDALQRWLQEWVYDVPNQDAYLAKLGAGHFDPRTPEPTMSGRFDYGSAP